MINYFISYEKAFENSGLSNAYILRPYQSFIQGKENIKYNQLIRNKLKVLPSVGGYGSVLTMGAMLGDSKENIENLLLTNKNLLLGLKLDVSKGKWFEENDFIDGKIPVILSTRFSKLYNIGENIEINFYKDSGLFKEQSTYKVRVIGFISKDDYYLNVSNNAGIRGIFIADKKDVIMPLIDGMLTYDTEDLYGANKIIIPQKGSSQIADLDMRELKKFGEVYSLQKLMDSYKEDYKPQRYTFLIIGIAVFLVSLFGLGGNNLLSLLRQEKDFAVYNLCGMKWKMAPLLIFMRTFIVIFIACLFNIVTLAIIKWKISNIEYSVHKTMQLGFIEVFFSIILCLVIIIVATIIPIIKISNKKPISIIREWV